jgi:hypothetical protein
MVQFIDQLSDGSRPITGKRQNFVRELLLVQKYPQILDQRGFSCGVGAFEYDQGFAHILIGDIGNAVCDARCHRTASIMNALLAR